MNQYIKNLLISIHDNLYNQALEFSEKNINRIEDWSEIANQTGWFEASWSEDPETEIMLKEKYGIVSRVMLEKNENIPPKNKKCFISGKEAKHDWLFAKCY